MFRCLYPFLLSTLLLSGCRIFRPATSVETTSGDIGQVSTSNPSAETKTGKETYVLGITVTAKAEKDSPPVFGINNVMKSEGFMKKNTRPAGRQQLVAVFLDANSKVLDIVPFNNPLMEHKESVDDNGRIITLDTHNDNQPTLIRVNFNSYIYSLEIREPSGKKLQTIELKKYIK